MAHSIQYYINANHGPVGIQYQEIEFPPSLPYVTVEHISDLDPDDYSSPDYAYDSTDDKYYQRSVYISSDRTDFTMVVIIDGNYGNASFTCESILGIANVTKDGSEVIVHVGTNGTFNDITDTIKVYYTSSPEDCIYLPIHQSSLHTALVLDSYDFSGCNRSLSNIPINGNSFEFTFDTLTDKHDCNIENLTFHITVAGTRNRFFVQNIEKYAYLEAFNTDSYTINNGKYYRNAQKYTNGQMVTYFKEVYVIDNNVYDKVKYDDIFKVHIDNILRTLSITSYGRVFMEPGAFYVLTIANADRKSERCTIRINYSDNPS